MGNAGGAGSRGLQALLQGGEPRQHHLQFASFGDLAAVGLCLGRRLYLTFLQE